MTGFPSRQRFSVRVMTSHPAAVTSTSSSIRTPPISSTYHARFHGEHHPRFERRLWQAGDRAADARLFVNLEPKPVTRAVPERLAQPVSGQHVARRAIDRARHDAGPHRRDCGALRLGNGVQQTTKLGAARQSERSGSNRRSIRRRRLQSPAPLHRPRSRPVRLAWHADARCWAPTPQSFRRPCARNPLDEGWLRCLTRCRSRIDPREPAWAPRAPPRRFAGRLP